MSTSLKIFVGAVGLLLLIVGGSALSAIVGTTRRNRRIDRLLEPVRRALSDRRSPEAAAVHALAKNPLTRNNLGELLSRFGRLDLFPREYFGSVPMAESDMVAWLAHPHELGAAPDEIEHTSRVSKDAGTGMGEVTYFVFRFRVHKPHWAAKNGWMAGVAGPYRMNGDEVVARGSATFSELAAYDSQTPEGHVSEIHQQAVRSGRLKPLARSPSTGAA